MQKSLNISLIILFSFNVFISQAQKKPQLLEKHLTHQETINKSKLKFEHYIFKESSKTIFSDLLHKFKEERKNNKKNLKQGSKYYNPISWIYKLLNL